MVTKLKEGVKLVDLNQTIEIEYDNHKKKPDGGVQMYVNVEGITNRYAMPVHLTPEQAAAMGDPVAGTRYKAKLVQSSLKDGKDGSWPSDFWYNVAIFEGVADERNIKKESTVAVATPPTKTTPQPKVPASITREDLIVKQVIFKEASNHAHGNTPEEVVRNLDYLFKEFTKVFNGEYKASPLVEEALKQGAKIVDIKTKEEPLFEPEESSLDNTKWDYKKPQGLVTYAEFVMYVKNCGWIMEDVIKWLGMEVEAYVSQPSKGYMTAAKLCKDKALEQGLEPPFDFRQEKK